MADKPGPTLEERLSGLGAPGEVLLLLVRGGRWWMVPVALAALVLVIALVALVNMRYVAPLIYVVF